METPVTADWVEAADVAEFADTDRKQVDLGGENQVGLFKLGEDDYAAIGIWCSHQRTTLMPGDVEDGEIMCPLHGARFDLRTGKNLSLPAVRPVASYGVKVENGKIYIKAHDDQTR